MADFSAVGGTDTSPATPSTSTSQPTQSTTPVGGMDISDDTPIRGVPGYNEPVRYGDLYKRLQGHVTKQTQSLAKDREAWERERSTHSEQIASERRRLETLAQTLISKQGGQGQVDPFTADLVKAQYIDGPMMGKFLNYVQEKGFAPIVQAFKERDQIIQGMYNQILNLQKSLSTLNGDRSAQEWEGKIGRWVKEGGYPDEAVQFAKELYLAYEGDDLDNEFPDLFKTRWEQLQSIMRAQDRARVDAAKRSTIRLPGKGGTGTPGKPIGLKGNERARDVASQLWDAMQTDTDLT